MLQDYPRQWILLPSSEASPIGGVMVASNSTWKLYRNVEATACVVASRGRTLALLGVAVDTSHPELTMGQVAENLATMESDGLPKALESLAGSYVIFVFESDRLAIFTDPAASCGVYLRRARSRVASSPSLLGDLLFRPEFEKWFGALPHNSWVPGRQSIYEDIDVLPANHSLLLPEWKIDRFWPRLHWRPSANTEDPSLQIACELKAAVEGVVRDSRRCLLSLTGGYDSRVNLAAAREVVPSLEIFTLSGMGIKMSDVEIAQRLANTISARINVIECSEPPLELLEIFDRVCARQAIGTARQVVSGCAVFSGVPSIHINGGLGVLLKNYYGATMGARSRPIKLRELLTDFDAPPEAIVRSVEEWLRSVESLPPQLQRTLMYLEQRASRWMGPVDLGSSAFFDSFSPFASRRVVIQAAFASDRLLEGGRLHKAVIDHLWPELLHVPFVRGRGPLIRIIPRGIKEKLRRIGWVSKFRAAKRDARRN